MAELRAQASLPRSKVPSADRDRRSRRGQRRRDGEQATAAGLDLLRVLGWLVLHDADVPGQQGGKVDHLVAGPSGVYVVNTVTWSGAITMSDTSLSVGKNDRSESLAEVAAAANAVRGVVGGAPVIPMLCFERLETVAGLVSGVGVCSSENILELLTGQPNVMDASAYARVLHSLANEFRPQSEIPDVPVDPPVDVPVILAVGAPLRSAVAAGQEVSVELDASTGRAAGRLQLVVEPDAALAEAETWQRQVEEPMLLEADATPELGRAEPPRSATRQAHERRESETADEANARARSVVQDQTTALRALSGRHRSEIAEVGAYAARAVHPEERRHRLGAHRLDVDVDVAAASERSDVAASEQGPGRHGR